MKVAFIIILVRKVIKLIKLKLKLMSHFQSRSDSHDVSEA